MPLTNNGLETIRELLCPVSMKSTNNVGNEENEQMRDDRKDSTQTNEISTPTTNHIENSTNITVSTSSTEFIPHIFYSINNIMKDPNNSSNQLETATGVIRHKLRSSKQVLMENDDTKILLNKSVPNWKQFIQLRENELNMKRNVLQKLNDRMGTLEETTTS
ncbi:mediator of RNA polymerase II transcription subunit 9 [Monosporozyma servazzii]